MLKVKALVSFSGIVTMVKGEEKEITNKEVYGDLLRAKYVEEVKVTKRKVKE
ncbi:hypothetical protein [Cytobacillus oceanisediminis]|uniref:hypothetical protein n=1 Tax=Cytobacillus oceanisediminis TaxID=665099 RepID=UPI0002D661BE|nr:hypothetical protein [Cytobacillus oceanisediminis]